MPTTNAHAGTVDVVLSAHSESLSRGFVEATHSLEDFEKQANALEGGIGGLTKALEKFGLMAAPIAALGAGFKIAMDEAERVSAITAATGLAADAIYGLEHAALSAGVGFDGLDEAVVHMNKIIGEAQLGSATATAALRALGTSVEQLKDMDAPERFKLLAGSVGLIGDRSEQTARSMEVFGKSSPKLISFFKSVANDSEGLVVADERLNRASEALVRLSDDIGISMHNIKTNLVDIFGTAVDFYATKVGLLNGLEAHIGKINEAPKGTDAVKELNNELNREIIHLGSLLDLQEKRMPELAKQREEEEKRNTAALEKGLAAINKAEGDLANERLSLMNAHEQEEARFAQRMQALADETGKAGTGADSLLESKRVNDLMEQMYAQHQANLAAIDAKADAAKRAADERKADALQVRLNDDSAKEDSAMAVEQLAYQRRLDELAEFQRSKAISEQRAAQMTEQATAVHQAKVKKIEEDTNKQRVQIASQMFGNLATLMNTGNRQLFEIGKVAAIGQATIDMYAAAQASWKFGAEIGGPVLGASFAATAVVAGLANIAKIASTDFGGGASGANSGGAGAITDPGGPVNAGTGFTDVGNTPAKPATQVTVNFSPGFYDQNSIRDFVDALNEAVGDGVVIKTAA